MRGDDHDRRAGRGLLEFAEGREAVHARELDIEEHHVGRVQFGFGESVFGGGRDRNAVLVALERAPQRPRDRLFVVDDEDGVWHVSRGCS